MTRIKVDLEELILSFGFDDEELAKEYFDRETGEIINIPSSVMKAAEGDLDETKLEDWEKELLDNAVAILEDCEDRYLVIPSIKSSYFYNAMVDFTDEVEIDDKVKEKLKLALNTIHPMREFKNVIVNYSKEQDLWYEYEDKKTKEYIVEWLESNKIDFEEI